MRCFSWACIGLGLGLSAAAATTYNTRASRDALALHRTIPGFNATTVYLDDPAGLEKRDGTKYVFMHHIVGNTFHYTQDTWADDIQQIAAKGVDAIALNIGGDDWQRTQIASAYAAAQSLNTPLRLFISFDFTTDLGCSLSDIVSRTQQFSSHPYQFRVNGKPMVSSYSGDCLGNSGWQSLKDQTGAYLMPFIWGLEGNFGSYPSMDSWYCWGCAWPQGDYDKNTDDDNYYISQLGTKYATTVSMWFHTHLADKNRILRCDDWLLNNRWEQLFAMRNTLTFVEMVTWNDYGESDYYGPVRVDQPAGTTWADGYPHTAWFEMSAYYIQAFKTGVWPAITQDVIYYWARPHPHDAIVANDGAQPDNWDWTQDYLWAAAFCSSTCTITLTVDSSTATFTNQPAGVNKLKLALAPGKISVVMVKNGQTVISKTEQNYEYVLNPTLYNFNAFVGAATATGAVTSTPTSTTSVTTTSTTTTTSTFPTPTSSTVDGIPWTYVGCYDDSTTARTLNNGIHTSTSNNTLPTCLRTCRAGGYAWAGVEYGLECWCAASMAAGVTKEGESDCNQACSGGSGYCGSGNRINIYHAASGLSTTTSTPTSPSTSSTSPAATASSTPSWTPLGCYTDSTASRTLNDGIHYTASTSLTVEGCLGACAASGYLYGGVEYGQECWCGSTISSSGTKSSSRDCSMPCSGKASETCGAGNRLSLYKASFASAPKVSNTWTPLGCYQDPTATRTLNNGIMFSSSSLTIESCQGVCGAAGYKYAGVEYAQECWCGSAIATAPVNGKAASGDCNMKCTGDAGELCGGGNRLFIYQS